MTALPLAAGNEIQECTDTPLLSDPVQVTNCATQIQKINWNFKNKEHQVITMAVSTRSFVVILSTRKGMLSLVLVKV